MHGQAPTLVVADWSVDPHAVVERCLREPAASYLLVVPARLNGLDWAGDPAASVPCAQRQVEALSALCGAAGLDLGAAEVGDPDPIAAICDALDGREAGEIVLIERARRLRVAHPLDLAHRAQRTTGLPVRRISLSAPSRARRRRAGHCEPQLLPAA
jgi:hypothetical protein